MRVPSEIKKLIYETIELYASAACCYVRLDSKRRWQLRRELYFKYKYGNLKRSDLIKEFDYYNKEFGEL